ncbi:diphosphomevalonate decarboxylase [Streptomyces aquilus]|uniref:diphosphomevalonate decarboxylase n=1 Tax=Streptomyces aquilus TaxID=2548456 RepID=UPI0036742FB0
MRSEQSTLHSRQPATGAGQEAVPARVPPLCFGQPVTPARPDQTPAATAVAHPNIALIKYWGKSDERLFLPRTDSLSMTLDIFPTTTRVRLAPEAAQDTVTFNGRPATGEAERRITAFLELVRERAGRAERADVDTENTVPTGAGLASSASGFAALAVAAAAAYGLELDAAGLSRLARRGSGSASRSIFGDFAIWHAGRTDGTPEEADLSSYAEPVHTAPLDPALVIAVVNAGPKEVSSRTAMRRTMDTSPLFEPWALSSKGDLADMRAALGRGDLAAVGEIAERNALGMHATMLAARPAVRYLSPATLTVLDSVLALRRDGVAAYATMDAGPNVKVLCRRADADRVTETVRAAAPGGAVHIAGPGPGARLLTEDGR